MDLPSVDLREVIEIPGAPIGIEKWLGLVVRAPEPLLALTGPQRLRQILFNLLSNAVKFTDAAMVSLILEADEERLVVHVADTGIGIAPDQLTQVFDPRRLNKGGPARTKGLDWVSALVGGSRSFLEVSRGAERSGHRKRIHVAPSPVGSDLSHRIPG